MENKTNKFGLIKMLAVLAVAFACVCMWGCGDVFREDGEKEFTGHYIKGNAKVVGFIDDSLVIVYDFQYWNQDLANGSQITGTGKQRLRVFNYRIQENGPRWADTLNNMTEVYDYVKGQLSDSVIWGGNGKTSFSFWKLGEEPVSRDVHVNKEDCDVDYGVRSLRSWLNETIIALGENSLKNSGTACQYAVLDTIANTLTYKRLNANLKWIEKCDDVRAWGKDVYCLLRKKENISVLLSVNNMIVDSLETDNKDKYAVYPALFAGNMLYLGENICSLEKMKMKKYPNVQTYLDEIKFVNLHNNIVSY